MFRDASEVPRISYCLAQFFGFDSPCHGLGSRTSFDRGLRRIGKAVAVLLVSMVASVAAGEWSEVACSSASSVSESDTISCQPAWASDTLEQGGLLPEADKVRAWCTQQWLLAPGIVEVDFV